MPDISIAERIRIAHAISEKIKIIKESQDPRLMSFETLYTPLNEEEKNLLEFVQNINPHEHGFNGEFFGIQDVPADLTKITDALGEQFATEKVAAAFQEMNDAMSRDINQKVKVFSAYRSPAYQLVVFLWNLRETQFDIPRVCKAVTKPGYSEHGAAHRQALDIMPIEESTPTTGPDTRFHHTAQYAWLKQNAHKFGFYESYPENNAAGIQYEPWHWHYEAPQA